MAIDFKNIVFKFVRIVGGVLSIDSAMTEKKFFATKPVGYYRCFIFPKADFAGNEYLDLVNLVSIEESEVWDRTNRNTFFGYNEEANTFICNINAYLGLKDSDLKTDGAISHPGQVGWYEMTLTATASDGIIKLKQTDGSDIYLTIDESKNVCVETTKRAIGNESIFFKSNALWLKSSEENAVIMTRNNAPSTGFSENFKIYSAVSGDRTINYQGVWYGKPIVSFPASTQIAVADSNQRYAVINNSGSKQATYKETSKIADVVWPGQTVLFGITPYQKYLCLSKNIPSTVLYGNDSQIVTPTASTGVGSKVSCYLKGLDVGAKNFIFNPIQESMYYTSLTGASSFVLNISRFKENLPDGFIALLSINNSHYRIKKDEDIKVRDENGVYSIISGSEIYPINLYTSTGNIMLKASITKDDLVKSTGFSAYTADTTKDGTDIFSALITITNTN